MNKIISNRGEIIFLYDVTYGNPNGDPLDENRPRIDEETGINIVTDVRLKRTIRDHLHDYKNQQIFILETRKEDGKLKEKEDRIVDLNINTSEDMLNKCIDIRLFGATTLVKKKANIIFTGPVQFKFGRSMHRVALKFIKGTTVMPSKDQREQGTFTGTYVLPYSLINFYGIINENSAKETKLTKDDVDLLLDGMWNGTKNLHSRSKTGQMPRFLLKVNYDEDNYHIGDLHRMISLQSEVSDEEIRDVSQVKLDVTELIRTLNENKKAISSIEYQVDDRLAFICDETEMTFEKCLSDIGVSIESLNL